MTHIFWYKWKCWGRYCVHRIVNLWQCFQWKETGYMDFHLPFSQSWFARVVTWLVGPSESWGHSHFSSANERQGEVSVSHPITCPPLPPTHTSRTGVGKCQITFKKIWVPYGLLTDSFSFLTFVLGYSWLIIMLWQFQMNSEGIQLYIYMYPFRLQEL